jgi:hypothetical protein
MPSLHEDWVHAMRSGDHARAWALNAAQLAGRRPEECDDPGLPYHQRWVWDGRPLDGRDVLVRCYHGLGDTLQFLRFLPELRRRAARVTLEIQPRLIPVLPDDVADRVIPFDWDRPVPAAERDVEIMDLSCALRLTPGEAPPPYLTVAAARLPPGTIGLCCRSGDWDPERSVPPELVAPLCQGRACVTLDTGPSPLPVRNPQGCPFDMVETAELVAGCALIITVDTMIAHLAGALGKPVWLVLKHEPDWRWAPASSGSEWYPAARIYAQPSPGDWPGAVARLARDLDAAFPAHSRCQPEYAR